MVLIPSDEFLLNRVQGQVGLYRISKRDLHLTVLQKDLRSYDVLCRYNCFNFWLLCYGQEILKQTIPELFNVIGFTYKQQGLLSDAGVAKFALPDMRGRTVMGLDDMGGTGAGRIAGLQGSELGNSGGLKKLLQYKTSTYRPRT